MNLEPILEHVAHFQRRVVQDAIADATGAYWERRAATFEWARPRPSDYRGRATEQQIADRDHRCAEAAKACRARASTSLIGEAA